MYFCQMMIFGTNSTSTGIPSLGCNEEGNFIQCKTAPLWYSMPVKTARLWNRSIVISALLWEDHACEAAIGTGSPGARPLTSQAPALLGSTLVCFVSALCCTGLLHCAFVFSILCQSALLCSRKMSSMFQLQLGKHILSGKGKCVLRTRGELA